MKLAFAGTPEFARIALAGLIDAGHEIVLVLTQPDRPAGRGMRLQPSAVKSLAMQHALALAQPAGLRLDGRHAADAEQTRRMLLQAAPQAIVVAAYGLILPPWLLALPPLGCINIHASLLPRWRGAAPIHRAIEAGDAVTGVTIMQMDAGLDTGAMLLTADQPIAADDTTATLHDKLAVLGARLIAEALPRLAGGDLRPRSQPSDGVSYAAKIAKAEAEIDWSQAAAAIERRLRAFDPHPGASTLLEGRLLKVWRARAGSGADAPTTVPPGSVIAAGADGVEVVCGAGNLLLTELQLAGGRRLPAAEFLQRHPLSVGTVLGAPAAPAASC